MEQTKEQTSVNEQVTNRPPVVLAISIDQNTLQMSFTTNAAGEYGYRMIRQALRQVEERFEQDILALAEQRIRAEISANGEVADGG